MIRAILIDDEVHCLDTLSILLNDFCPGVEIVERCLSPKQGLAAIQKHDPALVFLDIEISQENSLLYIKIADDGIGRKQSSALASKSATRHKSMGLQITADRIAMIQPAGSREVPVKIIDLVASDGSSAGTEIIITIPVIYD